VNGIEASPVHIDSIDYIVTDQNGLTSTSTRTIVIEAPSIVPANNASASSTDATTTPQ
jgi:hypothetical protein